MKIIVPILMLACLTAYGQANKRIDQYPNRILENPGDLLLEEDNLFLNYYTETRSTLNYAFVQQTPNAWGGPTNLVDLSASGHNNTDLYFSTVTPCSVTGFTNKSATLVQTATLTIFNGAGTNVTLYLPSTILTRDGSRAYVITNSQDLIISFRYHAGLNQTNAVSCPQF